MTQDAARDTPFWQEISHTGLHQHQQFRKFNREKLDKIRGKPTGPAAVPPQRAPHRPRGILQHGIGI